LERRTGRGTGRDVIDHPRALHDDLANAVAGALVLASGKNRVMIISDAVMAWASSPDASGTTCFGQNARRTGY
jgi:hypothetical protein